MFDGFLPKKRKLDEDEIKENTLPISNRPIKPFKSRLYSQPSTSNKILPKTLSSIFETGIVYTYMTFPQLTKVKKDEIVPMNLALESFWLQTELGNDAQSVSLPPLRFSCKFENIRAYFEEDVVQMSSKPFECAGIQYRLLLCH